MVIEIEEMVIEVGDAMMLLNEESDGMEDGKEKDDDGLQKRRYFKLRHRFR